MSETATDPGAARRDGDVYKVTAQEIERFQADGYVHLQGVLSQAEVDELEVTYDRLLRGDIEVPGRDFCDMSGDYSRPVEEYSIINVMLPRRYHPAWQDNVYERRAASIALQLCGPDMVLDYDQLLAKKPSKTDAVFHWHQDQAYWPVTEDPRTATCWLAIDDATIQNGCMRFVPGSHLESELRPHEPLHGDRGSSHTLVARVSDDDTVRPVEVRRGDITVHNHRVIHGSGGNQTDGWRRAYVVAFRSKTTVEQERAMGFTHSHNDDKDVLDAVGE